MARSSGVSSIGAWGSSTARAAAANMSSCTTSAAGATSLPIASPIAAARRFLICFATTAGCSPASTRCVPSFSRSPTEPDWYFSSSKMARARLASPLISFAALASTCPTRSIWPDWRPTVPKSFFSLLSISRTEDARSALASRPSLKLCPHSVPVSRSGWLAEDVDGDWPAIASISRSVPSLTLSGPCCTK